MEQQEKQKQQLRVTAKRLVLFLSVTLLASFTLAKKEGFEVDKCGPYCIGCNSSGRGCQGCYKHYITNSPVCSPNPSNDHCQVRTARFGNTCWICEKGWYTDLLSRTRHCFKPKNPIEHCRMGSLVYGDIVKCIACERGYAPTENFEGCEKHNVPTLEHCEWPTRVVKKISCLRCDEGYAVPDKGGYGHCHSTTVAGCWLYGEEIDVCEICDPYQGYFQPKANGQCVKLGSISQEAEKEEESLVEMVDRYRRGDGEGDASLVNKLDEKLWEIYKQVLKTV